MTKTAREILRMIIWKVHGLPTGHKLDDIEESCISDAIKELSELVEGLRPKTNDVMSVARNNDYNNALSDVQGLLK